MELELFDDSDNPSLQSTVDINNIELDFIDNYQKSTGDLIGKFIFEDSSLHNSSRIDNQHLSSVVTHEFSRFADTPDVSLHVQNNNEPLGQAPIEPENQTFQQIGTQPSCIVKSTDSQNPLILPYSFGNNNFAVPDLGSITIPVQPDHIQHVRYEKESNKTLRYIKAVNNTWIRVNLPPDMHNLWKFCNENGYQPLMQITRITGKSSGIIGRHPYPIWMKNNQIIAYNGSLYKLISENDIINGYIEINNLVLIILKQDTLETIDSLVVLDSSTKTFTTTCVIDKAGAKYKINRYHLHQSALHFQVMLVDSFNTIYPIDCICQTIDMTEFTGVRPSSNQDLKRKRSGSQPKPSPTNRKKAKLSTKNRSVTKSDHT